MVNEPRPRLAEQFLWFIIGFTVIFWISRSHADWFHFSHGLTLLLAVIIVGISESWPIELGRGHVSLSAAGYLSVFLVAGLTEAFWVLLVGNLLGWIRFGFRGLSAVANLAIMVLTLGLAGSVFHIWPNSPVIGVPLFALTFVVVNHTAVNFYYWLRDGRLTRLEIFQSLGWDSLGWAMSVPLVAIYVLLSHAYHAWWVDLLGLVTYATVTLLLIFYYQTRVSHEANRRSASASDAITAARDEEELLSRVRDAFFDVVGFTSFVVYLKDPASDVLTRAIVVHPDEVVPYPEEFVIDGEGLTSWALVTQNPEFIRDSRKSPSAKPSPVDRHPVVSGFILPLVVDREICGIIVLGHDHAYAYTRYDFEMVKVLAHHTAMAYRKWMLQEEALHLSRVDSLLNDVYNYRYFREVLDARISGWPSGHMALAFLDMDNFKKVNDRYGHLTGDLVLQRFVYLIRAELRERDIFARYGGDEFIVLFDNVDEQGVSRALARIQQRLENEHWVDLDEVLGVSAGFALYPSDGETPEMLLNAADLRMYRNKLARKAERHISPSG